MQNLKKYIAVILMGTMFVGNCVTVFADDDGHSSVGTGGNEGHVDKHIVSVTLTTVASGSTPFNYTVDPERLVEATGATKYSETFTDDAKRDGVYFLTSTAGTAATYAKVDTETVTEPDGSTTYYTKDGEVYTAVDSSLEAWVQGTDYYTQTNAGTPGTSSYDNKSATQTATSKSSADAELTVEVAVANDSNISLVGTAPSTDGYTEATVADADAFAKGTFYTKEGNNYTKAASYVAETTYYKESDPELYLALMVDDTTTVLEAGKTATKTVTIAGIDSNFETTYDGVKEEYKYTVKSNPAAWNTSSFYLTGVASKASAKGVTVPKLTVTWSYKDPAAVVDNTPSLSANKISAASNSVTVSNGTISSVVLNKTNNTTANLSKGTHYTVENGTLEFIATTMLSNNVGATITVSFEEGGTATLTIE